MLTALADRTGLQRRTLVRASIGATIAVAVLVGAYFVPLPSVGWVRQWADSMGPGFTVAFFVAYAVITIGPIPRTWFTVTSGVLFGAGTGFVGAMIATTIALICAFFLARRLGRERVQPFLAHRLVQAIEMRLQQRGWLAIGSLRLIPICPFSVANYAAGVSSVRFLPYLVASVICVAPGTASVVIIGNALAGEASIWQIIISSSFFLLGVAGLILDARLTVEDQEQELDSEKSSF